MKSNTLSALAAVITAFNAPAAFAQDLEAAARTYLTETVASWSSDPLLVEATRLQNARTARLFADGIIAMDNVWRAKTASADTPTINAVLGNGASDFLRMALKP